ncbi:MAG TPA: PilZ domain-containing protein [bacterium]|nr:PilZ domain-containing protein [bacterium]
MPEKPQPPKGHQPKPAVPPAAKPAAKPTVAPAAKPASPGAAKTQGFLEHRSHRRVDVKVAIQFQILEDKKAMDKLKSEKGVTKDISLEGLFLRTAQDIKPGDVFRLEIPLPGQKRPLFAFAEVVWVKEGKMFFKNDAGLKLMMMPVEDQEALKAYLDQAGK